MDPDAPWLLDDETPSTPSADATDAVSQSGTADGSSASQIPTGPPVPNPYAHILEVPHIGRTYTHWARNKHLQYKYLTEYSNIYYNDCIDYLDKRRRGIYREPPRPYEWGERVLKLYAKDDYRPTRDEWKYWFTTKNHPKPRASIFHAVHSKDYYHRPNMAPV